jgi:hypothetical protein
VGLNSLKSLNLTNVYPNNKNNNKNNKKKNNKVKSKPLELRSRVMNPSLLSQLLSPLCKSSSVRQSQIKKNCNFEICHLIAYLTFGNFVEFFKFDRVSLGDSPFGNTIGQSQSQQYQGAVQKGQSFIDWPNNI